MIRAEIGIREFQRTACEWLARVERGLHLTVTRHRMPAVVLLPAEHAHAWVMHEHSGDADADGWLEVGTVRIAPQAEEDFLALGEQARNRLARKVARIRAEAVAGHVVVGLGSVWALAAFRPGREWVAILALRRRGDLNRWLRLGTGTQPM